MMEIMMAQGNLSRRAGEVEARSAEGEGDRIAPKPLLRLRAQEDRGEPLHPHPPRLTRVDLSRCAGEVP
ncbi:MAG TPA: hypothetical protein VK741_26590 [Acetobacteraceae bacterium]|jgi:hypothetical protein|nr:hypothetical protein [Acetobacteraceae bacterium]